MATSKKAPPKSGPKANRSAKPKTPQTKLVFGQPGRQPYSKSQLAILVATGLAACGIAAWYALPSWRDKLAGQTIQPVAATTAPPPVTAPAKPPAKSATPPPPSAPPHDYVIPPVTDGEAPILSRIPTNQPVVFLGIDDGANKQAFELDLMKQYHIRASLFLADRFIKDNPAFFKGFVPAGSLIENHTLHHALLPQLSYDEQVAEICGQADKEAQEYGRRPVLFRPPGGEYNSDTPRAAAACGMKAVVLWIAKANGGSMQYQVGASLRPGDIVLMHFRPEFADDMKAFVDAADAAGLHTELLEDWLAPTAQVADANR